MSEMTGLERLRALGREQEERSWSTVGKVRGRLMLQIAEQVEDERLRERLAVERVASEMELHCLGVEGMDDSPVALWARELRDALDGREDEEVADVATIRKDAYDAYEWVEAHGGLDAMVELSSRLMTVDALRAAIEETCTRIGVEHTGDLTQDAQAIWREIEALRSRLNESVPRAAYERHLARRQRQIDESHAALRRRNRSIAELERRAAGCASSMLKSDASAYELQRAVLDQCKAFGVDVSECDTAFDMLHDMNETLSKRLMPEGMEWPRFEDGEPVRIGDEFMGKDGKTYTVKQVQLIGKFYALYDFCDAKPQFVASYGERVKRPAPEDSWERLEKDAGKETCEYFGSNHCDCSTCKRLERSVKDCGTAKARDIVRRAKALAGSDA